MQHAQKMDGGGNEQNATLPFMDMEKRSLQSPERIKQFYFEAQQQQQKERNRSRCPLVVAEVPRRAGPRGLAPLHTYTPDTHGRNARNTLPHCRMELNSFKVDCGQRHLLAHSRWKWVKRRTRASYTPTRREAAYTPRHVYTLTH
jgi:hypothetical protein